MGKGGVLLAGLAFCSCLHGQPSITKQPQDRTALRNSWVSFGISANGDAPLRYQWQFNGQDIVGAKSTTLSFIATPVREGVYSVRVADVNGRLSYAAARLNVVLRPVFFVQPRNTLVGLYGTATFNTRLNASGPYTRTIWHNYNPLEGSHEIPPGLGFAVDQPSLVVPDCLQNDSYNGLYWFAVTNGPAGAVSRRAKLTVVGPPVLLNEPQDATVHRGGQVVLRVAIAPDAAPSKRCQWYKDDTPIIGATRRIVVLRNVQPANEGNYYCVVTSMGGSTASWGAWVSVVP